MSNSGPNLVDLHGLILVRMSVEIWSIWFAGPSLFDRCNASHLRYRFLASVQIVVFLLIHVAKIGRIVWLYVVNIAKVQLPTSTKRLRGSRDEKICSLDIRIINGLSA